MEEFLQCLLERHAEVLAQRAAIFDQRSAVLTAAGKAGHLQLTDEEQRAYDALTESLSPLDTELEALSERIAEMRTEIQRAGRDGSNPLLASIRGSGHTTDSAAASWAQRTAQAITALGGERRAAEARLSALTETARVEIQRQALDVTERLIVGGLESEEARRFIETLPTVEDLMPPLSLADLGVKRWQPPEDAAAQLVTPLTPADRKRRRILRAIEANPGASDRRIAEIADCDHKTVARFRRDGKFPTAAGELPAEPEDEA